MSTVDLKLIQHSVIADRLSILRDVNSDAMAFREAMATVSRILAAYATADLPLKVSQVVTPLERADCKLLASMVTVVPVLRAGLAMMPAFQELLPRSSYGFIGLSRDEVTAKPVRYMCKLGELQYQDVYLLDPMLATGGSSIAALEALSEAGAQPERIKLITVLTAPQGAAAIKDSFPKVQIYTASLERSLNAQMFILPGLGDSGDRWAGY